MSTDAGECWYLLVQSDGDLTMIARSLRQRADHLRADAKGRKFAGERNVKARQMLRAEADTCILIARRAEDLLS